MKKLTFDEIRKRGLLLYEYVRGSKLYNTDTPDSDEDIGGVFIAPIDFDFKYQEEVSDDKNDSKWWELGKFMEMAMTSNPAVLEAFFVPDEQEYSKTRSRVRYQVLFQTLRFICRAANQKGTRSKQENPLGCDGYETKDPD